MASERTHRHLSVHDWVMLFETLDDERSLLTTCETARALWAERMAGLERWVEHIESCPDCREIARGLDLYADGRLDCTECRDALQVVFDLVDVAEHYEPVTVLELHRADRFLDELAKLPLSEQVTRVRAEPTYQQWGFAQKLLLDAKAAWHSAPEVAHDRALLAIAVAEKLDPVSYNEAWIFDLQAKAHAYLGNAHRILGDFYEAEKEFVLAEACLRHGVGSGLVEARVFSLKASLLNDGRKFREALALLEHVERFYRYHGAIHEAARVTLKRGHVLWSLGQAAEAAEECARSAKELDPREDPLLPLLAQKNTVEYLLSAGEVKRARSLFQQLPTLPEPLSELRRSWVEANLLRAEGRHGEARMAYERVRTGFAAAGIFYDAALASLDLAITAFEGGHHRGEVRLMAEEATVQLTLAGAKAEAFTALRLLLQAVREESLSVAVIERIRRRVAALQPS